MPHFKVNLPAGLELLVQLTHNPVNFKIRYPEGKEVVFDFAPNPQPHAKVDAGSLHVKTMPAVSGGRSQSIVSFTGAPGEPAISYSDADGGGSRDMELP